MKKPPNASKPKRITYPINEFVWTTLPLTIEFLRKHRDLKSSATLISQRNNPNVGFNATILLLSAACVEGFLCECLDSLGMFDAANNPPKFDPRFTFKDYPNLFTLAVGNKVSRLIMNDDDIKMLFSFRNRLGHGRSVIHNSQDVPNSNERIFVIGKAYEQIGAYLRDKNLLDSISITGVNSYFTNRITDHFANLVKPYMEKVVKILNDNNTVESSKSMRHFVKSAFEEVHLQ